MEYFLTRIVKDLPDMELRINVFDYPCTRNYNTEKAPVLSFSRVRVILTIYNYISISRVRVIFIFIRRGLVT